MMTDQLDDDEISNCIREIFVKYVVPGNVLYLFHKYDTKVLTSNDIENVTARTTFSGNRGGAQLLLELLPRYSNWFQCLTQVLRDEDVKQQHVVELLSDELNKYKKHKDKRGQQGQSDESSNSERKRSINLLLIGRTGSGKSSTKNSILGKKTSTLRSNSMSSTVDDVMHDSATINGKAVTVVDGPSFKDDSLDTPDNVQSTLKMVEKAISLGSHGFNAVLIVLKYGSEYTKQEHGAIRAIKCFFGQDVVKKHGVIVWTHGDSFEMDTEDEDTSFESWCRDQTGNIADLLQECEYRCVLFNNGSKDEDRVKAQYNALMDMVDKIQTAPYTEDNFRCAEPDRRAILVRSKLPQLESDNKQFINEITSQLEQLNNAGYSNSIYENLQKMRDDLEKRRRDLVKKDEGTKVLEPLLLELKVADESVNAKVASLRGAVNLLLVGRTKGGKSFTGSSILGKKTFKHWSSSSTPTIDDVIPDTANIDGQTVTVVDGPSFRDDSLDTPDNVQSTLKMVEKAISLGSHGFNAVLIVLKYGSEYTKQEHGAIRAIKCFFGQDVVKKHGVIVWTHGDSFEMDTEDEDTSFESWCRDQTGNIADLLQECEYRCVLFNNRSKDKDKVKAQYNALMNMVDKIQTGPYTEDNFRCAEPDRRAILVHSKLPQLESDNKQFINEITSQLEQLNNAGYSNSIYENLQKMRHDLEKRRRDLVKEDEGTKVLESLLLELKVADECVNAKMHLFTILNQVAQTPGS